MPELFDKIEPRLRANDIVIRTRDGRDHRYSPTEYAALLNALTDPLGQYVLESLLTTLGDTSYATAASTWARLAGNITTTRKFLRQTGNGAASAAPAWDTLLAADVPASALSKVDDTNVTLTLGGTPTSALLAAASITAGWTGTLADARGGIDTGVWTAPAFDATNFTGGAGTWTVGSGDVTTFAYRLFGKTMTVAFVLSATTVSGTTATLSIKIPASKTANRTIVNSVLILDNLARTTGYATANVSGTTIGISRTDAANFAASTDQTYVWGEITFETT